MGEEAKEPPGKVKVGVGTPNNGFVGGVREGERERQAPGSGFLLNKGKQAQHGT